MEIYGRFPEMKCTPNSSKFDHFSIEPMVTRGSPISTPPYIEPKNHLELVNGELKMD